MDHEVLFNFFMSKPFSFVETHHGVQAIQESRQPKVNALPFSKMMEFATNIQQLGGLGQVTCYDLSKLKISIILPYHPPHKTVISSFKID